MTDERPPVIVVESSDGDEFAERCSELVETGYKLYSPSCGFVNSPEYAFCTVYQAILVDNLLND